MTNVSYWKILIRKKILPNDESQTSKLGRVLGTLDLAALGIGATLGVGVYVLAGHVSRDQAGPSVILSFLIAAAASFLAGLCYAEFGARVPKSGSAYIYSYVCIGEFIAFVIGWNLLLEYIIGSASVSKGLSLYLDTLINDTFKTTFTRVAPMHWDFLAEYFDFFAFVIPMLLGIALAFGLRKSAIINNVFTLVNIGIVLFVIIAGAFKADIANWRIDPTTVPAGYNGGAGGFFPFGFTGTLKGAATCFFGYVGFDCIATTGEEVKNPKKAIPMAILLSLFTIFMAYFGVSTVLTLMWPYYKQDVNAPLPYVFNEIGWITAKWIVAVGGIFGLIASLFGAMFPLPRIIYAIAQDGLIFRFLGDVSVKFQTPVTGTLCAALLTGTFAALFDLKALVNMLSIGTLLAYTVVAISILILRFSNNLDDSQPPQYNDANCNSFQEGICLTKPRVRLTTRSFFLQFFNVHRIQRPDRHSMAVAGILVSMYVISALGLALTIFYARDALIAMETWALIITGIFTFLAVILLVALSVQPRERTPDAFTVPLVPILPGISIFINIFLMLMLDMYTWIRFAIWMAIGIPMYIACVCCNANGNREPDSDFSHIKGVVKLNGTITRAYEREYSEYMKEHSNEENALKEKELERDIVEDKVADEVEEILKQAMQVVSLTGKENSCSSLPTSASLKSSSPTRSFDEILPESEVIDQLVEKKAGNGFSYFIDEAKTPEPEIIKIGEEREYNNAIAMLDNVLDDEEELSRKYSDVSLQSPGIREAVATAIVHQESLDENLETIQKDDPKNESNSFIPIPPDKLETPKDDEIDTPLQQEKAVFAKLKANQQHDFINKLNTLYKQKSVPSKIFTAKMGDGEVTLEKQSPNRPSLLHASSESSNLYLKELEDKAVHGIKMTENDWNKSEKICVYDIDNDTGEYVCEKRSREDLKREHESKQSQIPKPPKFDSELYNKSLGRTKAHVVLKQINIENDKMKDIEKTPTEIIAKNTKDIDSPDVNPNPRSIKDKLEAIFRQTLSNKENRVQKPKPQSSLEIPKTESTENEQVVIPSFKAKAKKFDTVEKQRALFANVLRQIDPETPKHLHQTPTPSRSSLTEIIKIDNNRSSLNLDESSSPIQSVV